jgi:coenzyme PQQ precursor peptide PqqA
LSAVISDTKLCTTSSGKGDRAMRKWTSPKVIEIAVGMEINCYACATA